MMHMQSPQSNISDDSDEFGSKLRRNSVSSPSVQSGPRRTLTEITSGDGEDQMDTDNDFYMDENDDQGAPIATLAGAHNPGNLRRLSSDNGPNPHGPRLRMPPPSPSEGHFRPRFGPRDPHDNYAPRDRFQEPFHRDPYRGDGFGHPPKRMPRPMRGGFYPRF